MSLRSGGEVGGIVVWWEADMRCEKLEINFWLRRDRAQLYWETHRNRDFNFNFTCASTVTPGALGLSTFHSPCAARLYLMNQVIVQLFGSTQARTPHPHSSHPAFARALGPKRWIP